MKMIIDIETGPLPKEQRKQPTRESVAYGNLKDPAKREGKFLDAIAKWESGEDAALNPITGQILLAGLMQEGEYSPYYGKRESDTLLEVSDALSDAWAENGIFLVGHNMKKFDVPFFIKRCWLNGITPPAFIMSEIFKYHSDILIDTMTYWHLGDRSGTWLKLENLAEQLDIEVPPEEMDSAFFWKHWEKDKKMCLRHNKQHCSITAQVAEKMLI